MKPKTASYEQTLLALALFGFFVPNGVFVFYALNQPTLVRAAVTNPISLVFMCEAFFLMLFIAWQIYRRGNASPGWIGFILLSLLGSMAFSIPFFLYLRVRAQGLESDKRADVDTN
jgi:hypothetical protein